MIEAEQVKIMRKLAEKLFKLTRYAITKELKNYPLEISEFHNIAYTSLSFAICNYIKWSSFLTGDEKITFDTKKMLDDFVSSLHKTLTMVDIDLDSSQKTLQ